jgi:hypothetical protein
LSRDDEDDLNPVENTLNTGDEITLDPSAEIKAVLDDLESLLKNGDVIAVLTSRGVNASLTLLAIDGVRAYLAGNKQQAAEDLGTVAEEIRARLAK